MLGKLLIKGCYYSNPDYDKYLVDVNTGTWPIEWTKNLPPKYFYGWGLRDAKNYVESVWTRQKKMIHIHTPS